MVQSPPVFNKNMALQAVLGVLNDKELMNYNISIGQGINSETVKFNNFLTLNEMVRNGYPIPPDILIEETNLNNATKEKIKNSMKAMQQVPERK